MQIDCLPNNYIQMLKQVTFVVLKRIYFTNKNNKLLFLYYSFKDGDKKEIKSTLTKCLAESKFFKYHKYKIANGCKNSLLPLKNINYEANLINYIIFIEGKCIIIEKIEEELFDDIICELKRQDISMIQYELLFTNKEKNNEQEEVEIFCFEYNKEIKKKMISFIIQFHQLLNI